jgi:hypothetical protein
MQAGKSKSLTVPILHLVNLLERRDIVPTRHDVSVVEGDGPVFIKGVYRGKGEEKTSSQSVSRGVRGGSRKGRVGEKERWGTRTWPSRATYFILQFIQTQRKEIKKTKDKRRAFFVLYISEDSSFSHR